MNKPFQVRQGLREREPAVAGVEALAEERERDLERAAGLRAERRHRLVEALPVVLDELARTPDRVGDGVVVAGERDGRRELDRPLQRCEVVAERVRAGVRVEADGRRDLREQVVACDEDPVAQQADVPVRVAGKLEHRPAVDLVALGKPLGGPGEADEGPEGAATRAAAPPLPALGQAVPLQVLGEPLRPVGAAPDASHCS